MEVAMLIDQTLDMLPDLEDPKACLQRAVKCEEMANNTAGRQQGMLLELAERWREMARELETKFGARTKKQPGQPNPSC